MRCHAVACRLTSTRAGYPCCVLRLPQAKALCGKGGDWERKNKLKVGGGLDAVQAVALLGTRLALPFKLSPWAPSLATPLVTS